jgi:hypothetical protein
MVLQPPRRFSRLTRLRGRMHLWIGISSGTRVSIRYAQQCSTSFRFVRSQRTLCRRSTSPNPGRSGNTDPSRPISCSDSIVRRPPSSHRTYQITCHVRMNRRGLSENGRYRSRHLSRVAAASARFGAQISAGHRTRTGTLGDPLWPALGMAFGPVLGETLRAALGKPLRPALGGALGNALGTT